MRIEAFNSVSKSMSNNENHQEGSKKIPNPNSRIPRQLVIGVILVFALLAFELFNFDTTRFALESLLGDIRFMNLTWAAILALAFCAIDFAGLAKLFTPERGADEPKEVWYLMGAWFLGATMNAIMTWWAVSLTLLDSQLGNEILSRDDVLRYVPVFVAALVWLTRILFIGALSVTGERLLYGDRNDPHSPRKQNRVRKALPLKSPVYSGSQGSASPALAPQAVDLSAAPAETNLRGTIRRPVSPVPSNRGRTNTYAAQSHTRNS